MICGHCYAERIRTPRTQAKGIERAVKQRAS